MMKKVSKITEHQIFIQKKINHIFLKPHLKQEILETIFFMKLTIFKFITYIIKLKIQIEQIACLKIKNL